MRAHICTIYSNICNAQYTLSTLMVEWLVCVQVTCLWKFGV